MAAAIANQSWPKPRIKRVQYGFAPWECSCIRDGKTYTSSAVSFREAYDGWASLMGILDRARRQARLPIWERTATWWRG